MEKLMLIQSELKAPKGQTNAFGKYKYRSCEDILEAVKPLLSKYGCTLTISDEIVCIEGRFYVKATALLLDIKEGKPIFVSAYAREEESRKGMDSAQLTGATSSYARKYALNGLFCIDDTKDSDATNTHGKEQTKPEEISSLISQIAKLAEKLFKTPDEFQIWRVENGLVEKLKTSTPMEQTKLLLKLQEKEKSNG